MRGYSAQLNGIGGKVKASKRRLEVLEKRRKFNTIFAQYRKKPRAKDLRKMTLDKLNGREKPLPEPAEAVKE